MGSIFLFLFIAIAGAAIYAYSWFTAPIEAKTAIPITQPQRVQAGQSARLIAHRGLSAQAPENTIPPRQQRARQGFGVQKRIFTASLMANGSSCTTIICFV